MRIFKKSTFICIHFECALVLVYECPRFRDEFSQCDVADVIILFFDVPLEKNGLVFYFFAKVSFTFVILFPLRCWDRGSMRSFTVHPFLVFAPDNVKFLFEG